LDGAWVPRPNGLSQSLLIFLPRGGRCAMGSPENLIFPGDQGAYLSPLRSICNFSHHPQYPINHQRDHLALYFNIVVFYFSEGGLSVNSQLVCNHQLSVFIFDQNCWNEALFKCLKGIFKVFFPVLHSICSFFRMARI